jgi:histidinol phosphatase-like enzyme
MRVNMTTANGDVITYSSMKECLEVNNKTLRKLIKEGNRIERVYASGYWEDNGVSTAYLKAIACKKAGKPPPCLIQD